MQLDEHTLGLLDSLIKAKAQLADTQEVVSFLQSKLVAALGDDDTATDATGTPVFTYKPSRKFNADKALTYLSDDVSDECKTFSYDPKKVKAKLTGDQLDACMDPGTSRTFKIVTA